MPPRFTTPLSAICLITFPTPALAEPTEILVRVISQDAKFVGDLTGGARVTLRDARTGKALASGVTKGSTGSTPAIMEARGRSPLRAIPDAAGFRTTLNIKGPTLINAVIEGPLGIPASIVTVTSQRWIMPGSGVTTADGWVVELPGLAITPVVSVTGPSLTISAKVELLCGCPITPGGMWAAEDYSVEASLWHKNRRISVSSLQFTTAPGGYTGTAPAPAKGKYRLVLFARNTKTGNSGLTEVPVTIR